MTSARSWPRTLAVVFALALAVYSGVWMYYVRMQGGRAARAFDYAYMPSAETPAGHGRAGWQPGRRPPASRQATEVRALDGAPVRRYRQVLDAMGRPPGACST